DSVAAGYGLDPASLAIRVECVPAGAHCPAAGATVLVTVSDTVSLPFMPDLFGLADATAIPVDATGTYRVERLTE
ncbi:MAG: TadE family protein, partial [Microbacterium gubbeenense]